jgi:cytochrome c-type biogenesis protein CcmH
VKLAVPTRAAAVVLVAAAVCTIEPAALTPEMGQGLSESAAARPAPRDSALERLTRQVSAQLRCPVCQGLSLADSPSELALEMKDVVRGQLAAGRTPDQVKGYFVAKYGEWILLEPPRRGVNLVAYLLPAAAIVVGLGVVWLMLQRWTRGASPADQSGEPDPLD